jgi:hypothetical protein
MGISSHEFLQYVIQPTLRQLGVNSSSAEQLLLATANFQSGLGKHLQIRDGIGVYGISEQLHREVWDCYLAFDPDLASTVRGMASQHEFPKAPHLELATNLSYATAIAWMIYRYRRASIPEQFDVQSLAKCWQNCFLDAPGDAKDAADFICSYNQLKTQSAVTSLAA